jgi:zinc transporter ZupT
MGIAPPLLVALLVSALLGLIGGSGFYWAGPTSAWNIFVAAFLWTLIASVGTTLGCYVGERLPRGQWWRTFWVAGVMSFPLTIVYALVAFWLIRGTPLAAPPQPNNVLPFFFAATLAVALFVALSWVLSSPFRKL